MRRIHPRFSFQRKRPPSAWSVLHEYRLELIAGAGAGLAIGATAKYLAAACLIFWLATGGR